MNLFFNYYICDALITLCLSQDVTFDILSWIENSQISIDTIPQRKLPSHLPWTCRGVKTRANLSKHICPDFYASRYAQESKTKIDLTWIA